MPFLNGLGRRHLDDTQAEHPMPRLDLDRPLRVIDVTTISHDHEPAGRQEELELSGRRAGEQRTRGLVILPEPDVGRPPPVRAAQIGMILLGELAQARALDTQTDAAGRMHHDRHRLAIPDLLARHPLQADDGKIPILADRVDAGRVQVARDLEFERQFALRVRRRRFHPTPGR